MATLSPAALQGAHKRIPVITQSITPHLGRQLVRPRGSRQLGHLYTAQALPDEAAGAGAQASSTVPAAMPQPATAELPAVVAVVTTLGCPYCKKAKAALQQAGIAYEELELSERLDALATIKELTGQSTVPQVFVGGKLTGGASDLLPKLEDGSFQQLVASAAASALDPLPLQVRQVVGLAAAAAQGSGSGSDASLELKQLAAELRTGGPSRETASDGTFPLQAAVDWLGATRGFSPAEAVAALARLQSSQLLTVVEEAAGEQQGGSGGGGALPLLGRLLGGRAAAAEQEWQAGEDVPITQGLLSAQPGARVRLVGEGKAPAALGRPLNVHFRWFGPARPAEEVSAGIQRALLALYDRHLTGDGKKVDYEALKADPDWKAFVDMTAELQKADLSSLSREQRLAFFINIYNALVLHATAVLGPATDTLSRGKWFGGIKYVIGGREFSSDDIEHGVLRSNAPSPASLLCLLGLRQLAGGTFKEGDPRATLAIAPMDPRIHFALNCGANSCPAIKVYSPDNLEFGLAAAASAFCASEVQVYPERNELNLSMILKWYGGDFGSRLDLLNFLARHLPAEPKAQLEAMLSQSKDPAKDIKVTFRAYDWGVNAK